MHQFVILYRNQPDVRDFIEQWVVGAIQKGLNFSQPIQTPFFQTRPVWPNPSDLFRLPLWVQVEEVKITNNKMVTQRALIIDAESIEETVKPKVVVARASKRKKH